MAPPSKPSLLTPIGNLADARTFRFSVYSPTGGFQYWGIQVADRPDMSGTLYWNAHDQTGGMAPQSVTIPYTGQALPIGPSLYWRARARNAEGYGPWSDSGYFRVDPTPPGARDVYAEWAGAILADMARPRVALVPGTIRPHGSRIAELVTADYGDRWRLYLPDQAPPVYADLAVAGMTVELSAGMGWEVTAVTGRVPGQGHSGDYLARAMTLGPNHHWRLGDPAGALRVPYVGALVGIPGGVDAAQAPYTAYGPVGPDEPDGSLSLNAGAGSYLEMGDAIDVPGTAPFTLACWIGPHLVGAAGLRIVSKEATSGYRLMTAGTDTLNFARVDAAGVADSALGPAGHIELYGWTHAVATYDGAAMRVYLDGVSGTSVPSTRSLPGNAAQWTVGRQSGLVNASRQYVGLIDELSVFPRALTPAEVTYLYGGGT